MRLQQYICGQLVLIDISREQVVRFYACTRVKIMSLLFNRIEQRCAAQVIHTCQQY
jgi:hypothetical protein